MPLFAALEQVLLSLCRDAADARGRLIIAREVSARAQATTFNTIEDCLDAWFVCFEVTRQLRARHNECIDYLDLWWASLAYHPAHEEAVLAASSPP